MGKPLIKQNIPLPLAAGVDTKSDPWQLDLGKFIELNNIVYTTDKMLQKRNGFAPLTTLPTEANTLTTFSEALLALGDDALYSYSPETAQWYNKGSVVSLDLDTTSLVRSGTSQSQQDAAVTSNGLICTVWKDSDGACKYSVLDTASSQILVTATSLPATATLPRVFVLGKYFIITFLATVTAQTHLQYIALPLLTPATPGTATDLETDVAALTSGYDCFVSGSNLYAAYSASGPNVKVTYLDTNLTQHGTKTIAGKTGTYVSVTSDTSSTGIVYITFFDTTASKIFTAAYDTLLNVVYAATQVVASVGSTNSLTSIADDGVCTIFYQTANTYGYTLTGLGGNAISDYVSSVTMSVAGTPGSPAVVLRGVGLASKPFSANGGNYYLMVAYGSNSVNNQNYQPTYFMIDATGHIISKLAQANGGGYPASLVLPGAWVYDDVVNIGYLYKAALTPVNKSQDAASVAGFYAQTGVNLATWAFNPQQVADTEIANNLHITGGMFWMYDGVKPVEHSFHIWPEDILATWAATGGSIVAKPDGITNTDAYYYQVAYEWTDAQGNLHRSAPSIPIFVTTTGSGSAGSVVLKIPTLRLTSKTGANKVRLVIYRWSVAQELPYQITSVSSPTLNDTTVDSVTYTDTLADASILGNQILYTFGGIVENIAAPALIDVALFKTRMIGINAEDQNQIWFSKQVPEGNVPVEFNDGFTIYCPPTMGSQGSTGPCTTVAAMDDKAIIFKRNAMYYVAGDGPDNLGNNNDFTTPQFITSAVGCTNKQSIVFIPQGIMFQSDKGIWLLTRGLATEYIGAPVEIYNDATVLSAVCVPGTTQVRFTLDNGITLMYDYYYQKWGFFTFSAGIKGVSATLFENLHTFIDSNGRVYQETPDSYLDGTHPVLISFKSGWINLSGLQGYERLYWLLLLANWKSPHTLQMSVAYDFSPNPENFVTINPDNYNAPFGEDGGNFGDNGPMGGNASLEDWRLFVDKQQCQSFQVQAQEFFDPSYGTVAGEGLTISGIGMVAGLKKPYRVQSAAKQAGTAGSSNP